MRIKLALSIIFLSDSNVLFLHNLLNMFMLEKKWIYIWQKNNVRSYMYYIEVIWCHNISISIIFYLVLVVLTWSPQWMLAADSQPKTTPTHTFLFVNQCCLQFIQAIVTFPPHSTCHPHQGRLRIYKQKLGFYISCTTKTDRAKRCGWENQACVPQRKLKT